MYVLAAHVEILKEEYNWKEKVLAIHKQNRVKELLLKVIKKFSL